MISAQGTVYSKKLLSTPGDYSAAIEDGVADLCRELAIDAQSVIEFRACHDDRDEHDHRAQRRQGRVADDRGIP
jgi:hypothetical protein